MGAWGCGIYQDDMALDIKEEFVGKLKRGKEAKEASKEIIEEYITEEDEELNLIVWSVLADQEWKLGRLEEEIKKKAIEYIEEEKGLEVWKESGGEKDYKKRKQVLEKLKEQIESEQPEKKKITKAWVTDWKEGDIYAYRLTGEESKETEYYNKYVIMQKVGEYDMGNGDIYPIVYFYEEMFEELPTIEELRKIAYMQTSSEMDTEYVYPIYRTYIGKVSRQYKKNLTYIGNDEIRKIENEYVKETGEATRNGRLYIDEFDKEWIRFYRSFNRKCIRENKEIIEAETIEEAIEYKKDVKDVKEFSVDLNKFNKGYIDIVYVDEDKKVYREVINYGIQGIKYILSRREISEIEKSNEYDNYILNCFQYSKEGLGNKGLNVKNRRNIEIKKWKKKVEEIIEIVRKEFEENGEIAHHKSIRIVGRYSEKYGENIYEGGVITRYPTYYLIISAETGEVLDRLMYEEYLERKKEKAERI